MARAVVALALSDLGRDALRFVMALALAIMLASACSVSTLMTVLGATVSGHEVAEANTEEPPAEHLEMMHRAANETCGVPWQVIAAIAKVESNFGSNMATSSAGAIGYNQFLPSSWAAFGNGGAPSPEASATLATVVMLARTQIGRPYVWGGASPATSFDCSGLVQWAFGQFGDRLPRTAQQQCDATRRLARKDLRPGDLVLFERTHPSHERITHVGIYVGDGRMVNAPTIGDVIREMDVFTGYGGPKLAGGNRVG